MKALTVCNPYPELILIGEKRVENREWRTTHRGWLLLHAGQSRAWLQDGDMVRFPNMAWGAIVGEIEIVDCVNIRDIECGRFDADPRRAWLRRHVHAIGLWCWVIGGVRRLGKPVPWQGARKLWDVDDAVARSWSWMPAEVIR